MTHMEERETDSTDMKSRETDSTYMKERVKRNLWRRPLKVTKACPGKLRVVTSQ